MIKLLIDNLESLLKLELNNNYLTTLPESIVTLKSLHGLYLNQNPLINNLDSTKSSLEQLKNNICKRYGIPYV